MRCRLIMNIFVVLRLIVNVLARTDSGLWYLLDLRRQSAPAWVPVVWLLVAFAFAAFECLLAGDVPGAAIFAGLASVLFAVKLRVCVSA
jgi:hypothetical protein